MMIIFIFKISILFLTNFLKVQMLHYDPMFNFPDTSIKCDTWSIQLVRLLV